MHHDVDAVDAGSQRSTWAFGDDGGSLAMYSFRPVCGRVFFADMDVAQTGGETFPSGCASALTPEQEAFAYFFFDYPACAIDY